jgi:hypothetical protein
MIPLVSFWGGENNVNLVFGSHYQIVAFNLQQSSVCSIILPYHVNVNTDQNVKVLSLAIIFEFDAFTVHLF